MPLTTVRDLVMHYHVQGDGFPLLMLHGLGGNLEGWDGTLVEALAARYSVITLDNRGSGKTRTPPASEYSVEGMALDTTALMEVLDIDKANVLGHSLGGMIAQLVALESPERVEKLVLCSTNCGGLECMRPDKSVTDRLLDQTGTLEEKTCRYMSTLFPQEWIEENQEYVDDLTQTFLEVLESNVDVPRQFMASVRFETCERLGEIKSPTLVVCGTEDEVIPPGNSRILAKRIPGAELFEFENAGHGFFSQVPEQFATLIIEFLG
jgi:pimeloyl-ACP methyl ester carboxylesterase